MFIDNDTNYNYHIALVFKMSLHKKIIDRIYNKRRSKCKRNKKNVPGASRNNFLINIYLIFFVMLKHSYRVNYTAILV